MSNWEFFTLSKFLPHLNYWNRLLDFYLTIIPDLTFQLQIFAMRTRVRLAPIGRNTSLALKHLVMEFMTNQTN